MIESAVDMSDFIGQMELSADAQKTSEDTWSWTWNYLGQVWTYYRTYDANDQDYEYYMHYDIHLNDDGSGTIDYYFYDELFYHME